MDSDSENGSDVMSDIDSFGDDESDRSDPDSGSDFSEVSADTDDELSEASDFSSLANLPIISSAPGQGIPQPQGMFAFPPTTGAAQPFSAFNQTSSEVPANAPTGPQFNFVAATPVHTPVHTPVVLAQFNFGNQVPQTTSFPQATPFPQGQSFAPPPSFTPAPFIVPTIAHPVVPADVKGAIEALKAFPTSYILGSTIVKPENTDIYSFLVQTSDESPDEFESRKRLSVVINSIPGLPLTPLTSVVVGYCLCKKAKLGVTYEVTIESALSHVYQAALASQQGQSVRNATPTVNLSAPPTPTGFPVSAFPSGTGFSSHTAQVPPNFVATSTGFPPTPAVTTTTPAFFGSPAPTSFSGPTTFTAPVGFTTSTNPGTFGVSGFPVPTQFSQSGQ